MIKIDSIYPQPFLPLNHDGEGTAGTVGVTVNLRIPPKKEPTFDRWGTREYQEPTSTADQFYRDKVHRYAKNLPGYVPTILDATSHESSTQGEFEFYDLTNADVKEALRGIVKDETLQTLEKQQTELMESFKTDSLQHALAFQLIGDLIKSGTVSKYDAHQIITQHCDVDKRDAQSLLTRAQKSSTASSTGRYY